MQNEKYSYGDFSGQRFLEVDPQEFNDSEIVGSCFAQQLPADHAGETLPEVFPAAMKGVVFRRCNLDNVLVPPDNTVEPSCCRRRIKMQNDLEDWVLNERGEPVKPVAKKAFLRLGLSIDPRDLPDKPLEEPVTERATQIAAAIAERDEAQANLDALQASKGGSHGA